MADEKIGKDEIRARTDAANISEKMIEVRGRGSDWTPKDGKTKTELE